MATNPKQIKINMLAKDFNMKTKDVIDILAAAGIDKKTSGTIDADEFSVFLNHATINHQVTNMSDYLAGKADIPKETMKKNEPVKSESNTKTPKAKTTGSGNASKETATKNSAEKESTSKTLQSKTPAVKAPLSQVVEIKEEQSSVVSVKETSEKSVSVKEETVKETPMKETSAKENVKEMPKRENTTKTTAPVKSSVEPKQLASEENKHSERNHNERNTNVPQKTFASNRNESQNTERRQQNHSPKTTENAQNRPQFAQKQNPQPFGCGFFVYRFENSYIRFASFKGEYNITETARFQ